MTAAQATHDPLALEVVAAIEEILQPKDILLFGSRARGNWRADSDIDALAIFDDAEEGRNRYKESLNAGRAKALELYGRRIDVQLVFYSEERFNYLRQAKTHTAYDAAKEGISVRRRGGEDYGNEYREPEIPNNWPDIEQRFTNAQRHLDDALIGLEHGASREGVGWNLQHGVENALKGYLAHMGYDDGKGGAWDSWHRSHDMTLLQDIVNEHQDGKDILGGMDFSDLTEYAVKVQYHGEMRQLQENEVYDAVEAKITRFMEYSERLAGTELPKFQRDVPRREPGGG